MPCTDLPCAVCVCVCVCVCVLQRNAEMVKLQEDSVAKQEAERLRIEQQIQAERKASEAYAAELQKEIARECVFLCVCVCDNVLARWQLLHHNVSLSACPARTLER